jgi:hypothetical protein
MKELRILKFIITVMLLTGSAISVCAQEPETIEEAIQKIKTITDPDPFRQDRLRAEEARKIVSNRVTVINDGSGTFLQTIPMDVWNWVTENGNLKSRGEVLSAARAKGWDLGKVAWIIKGGQCDEHASLMQTLLQGAGVQNVKLFRSDSPHVFPVVNAAPDAEADIPWTWGPNAFVPDSWANESLNPVETWEKKLYFNNGESFVGGTEKSTKDRPAAGKSARQLLQEFGKRGESFISQNCAQYRRLLNSYFKIPAEARKKMSYRPLEDLALEEGRKEIDEIKLKLKRLDSTDDDYGPQVHRLHAAVSNLEGKFQSIGKCCEEADAFSRQVKALFQLLPALKTDASSGEPTDDIPSDIARHTGEVKVTRYFVFLLTNASNGLYVGSEDSLKGRTRCSFEGGGINCAPTDVVAYKKLLGPFATQGEAHAGLCKSITESRIFPLAVGLKGRWQGGSWYGLWDSSTGGCSK